MPAGFRVTIPRASPVTRSVTKWEWSSSITVRNAPQCATCFSARVVRPTASERTTWMIAMIANRTVVSCQNGALRAG